MPRIETILLLALCLPVPSWAQSGVPDSTAPAGVLPAGLPLVAGLQQAEPLPQPVELKPELPQFRPSNIVAEAFAGSQSALKLHSAVALVIDQEDGQLLYAKNTDAIMPIASITKLMTAVVVLDAKLPLDEPITISREDVDTLKGTRSRLKLGVTLPRQEMLRLALMASENRAAAALARTYPGGTAAFIRAMNQRAHELGMHDTRYVDPTGLDPDNVSTARRPRDAWSMPDIVTR